MFPFYAFSLHISFWEFFVPSHIDLSFHQLGAFMCYGLRSFMLLRLVRLLLNVL
jgi:hypothetical protein